MLDPPDLPMQLAMRGAQLSSGIADNGFPNEVVPGCRLREQDCAEGRQMDTSCAWHATKTGKVALTHP